MAEPFNFLAEKRYAVVTGANKGIGLEICKQLASQGVVVLLTSRDGKKGLEALNDLIKSGISADNLLFHQLDVTDAMSIATLTGFINSKFGKLDILVNNAGTSGFKADFDALKAAGFGTVSILCDSSFKEKGWPSFMTAYILSKAALNAYTQLLAKKYPSIIINCVFPGYVSTDINGNTGYLTVEEGGASPVRLALLPHGSPSGLFFLRNEVSSYE
ncbi:(+)-neomenthol dehydrogenase-like [Chenopodium quinoa]|uniref:(+)-neomenthol dehydrogenase-like n=1 Tax=Chenopodium quinoa TaxID=63459 RepID=UPI000B7786DB|nr:(+)-neomenthol dehydrogenase-like [Chenopodium quinoa]